jgi:L-histidine N-alpha-methyltransferase
MNYSEKETKSYAETKILNYLPEIGLESVQEEIYRGLVSQPKSISPKFFYDEKGSELFEQITHLSEYYPTRAEKSILTNLISLSKLNLLNFNIIELGSGDASKIGLLLEQLPSEVLSTISYFPVDISKSAIKKSIPQLKRKFNLKNITGVVTDFIHKPEVLPKGEKNLFCFFGSTIGNLTPVESKEFMMQLGEEMNSGDYLLLGMDMVKDFTVLENAYNDALGITSEFNKNILNVVNTLINSDFDTADFIHLAFFNSNKNRIEMHLKAIKDVEVQIKTFKETLTIKKDETIHTENSHKFTDEDIYRFADYASLSIEKILKDRSNFFSLVLYRKKTPH